MEYLEHYGTPRHSGRYPWGSGENPYQSLQGMMGFIARRKKEGATDKEIAAEVVGNEQTFYNYISVLHEQGVSDVDIAKQFGRTTTWLRQKRSIAVEKDKAAKVALAIRLRDHGYSYEAIAEKIGVSNESTVRSLLKRSIDRKEKAVENTANALEKTLQEHGFVDVGRGNDAMLGVTKTRFDTALQLLKDKGYQVLPMKVEQVGTGYKTTRMILCKEGTTIQEVYANRDKIALATGFKAVDNGQEIKLMKDPVSIDPKRVSIRYAEDGGKNMDGVIQLRRGVDDLSMGDARYAQVRIKVGEDSYLKGMAIYSDDLPAGVDIMFNTNKTKDVPFNKVLKELKRNKETGELEDNPFGAIVDQIDYIDSKGKSHQSPINIVNEEGDWADWSKTIASQVLSKQPLPLVKKQLDKTYKSSLDEYEEIMALTNPAVKKVLLEEFASECDSAAVHLKAIGFDRQGGHVIIPVTSLKDNEIYAPRYKDGERVALIRYPHAGQFEIPDLVVNNKNREGISVLGKTPKDAVGINPHVAQILSGADFDGDTVSVIPNNSGEIKTMKPLKDLENFDPSSSYPAYKGMVKVGPKSKSTPEEPTDGFRKGMEMGLASNLITDMTIKGASPSELARAVKYSMVVIDAEKHQLNWKQAYEDLQISQLNEKYTGRSRGGASTIISKAKGMAVIPQRSMRYHDNPETGERTYEPTGDTRWKKEGDKWVEVPRVTKSNKMTEAFASGGDAYSLVSEGRYPVELAYADYANKMKALGNKARKEMISTPGIKKNPSATETYKEEVESLNRKVLESKKNAAYEAQAQNIANIKLAAIRKEKPDMDMDELKKVKSQCLNSARRIVKGDEKRSRIDVTPKEWEAIQAGAISNNMLSIILKKADMSVIKGYATPRSNDVKLTSAQIKSIATKMSSGRYTAAEIADQYGISVNTLYNLVSENK